MSKRVRTLETLGSLPYTTVDGGKWLKKALDPVDLDVEVQGLPDTSTNARCVLNYQFQGDIPVPNPQTYIPSTTQSYDTDFYVFQNPVTLGMSASRPSGMKNPIGCTIHYQQATVDANYVITKNATVTLPPGFCPSTVQIFENPQIEGDSKNEKLANLQKYCQRWRMIYGGVQCIPACSALFDSGTIEATQQIFSPQEKNINDEMILSQLTANNPPPPMAESPLGANIFSLNNSVKGCQRFEKDDFPDEGSSIQNPAALFCRYKEGLYMPYKIRNPLVYEYKSSEKHVVTEAPYIVTDKLTIIGTVQVAGQGNPYASETCNYDASINGWKATRAFETATAVLFFHCVSKTGVPFYLVIRNPGAPFVLPDVAPSYNSANFQFWQSPSTQESYCYVLGGAFEVTAAADEVVGKSDAVFDIPYKDNNVGIICFRSIGLQASIRVIFRFGLEMMITAGSVYSPFKHKSPKYDQKALNSYIQATHNMRDAFLGNAATPEGHAMFAAHVAAIAANGDNIEVSNQGSRWYGQVSV